jgi:hypothetical protein
VTYHRSVRLGIVSLAGHLGSTLRAEFLSGNPGRSMVEVTRRWFTFLHASPTLVSVSFSTSWGRARADPVRWESGSYLQKQEIPHFQLDQERRHIELCSLSMFFNLLGLKCFCDWITAEAGPNPCSNLVFFHFGRPIISCVSVHHGVNFGRRHSTMPEFEVPKSVVFSFPEWLSMANGSYLVNQRR